MFMSRDYDVRYPPYLSQVVKIKLNPELIITPNEMV